LDIYTKLSKGRETVALRIDNICITGRECGHIILDVVHVADHDSKFNNSMWFYENYFDQKNKYKNLAISCQLDGYNEAPYGWKLFIKPNMVNFDGTDLEEAEQMVKTLRPIHRKLDKIRDIEGEPKTFVDFVLRIVRVLKIKAFYAKDDNNIQYSRNDNIGQIREHLQNLISDNMVTLNDSKVA